MINMAHKEIKTDLAPKAIGPYSVFISLCAIFIILPTHKEIKTDLAPKAIGPYSQAIDLGDLVFVSGQIPLDPETMEVVGTTIEEQTTQVMKNLEAILKEANLTFTNAVKFTIYLTD